MTKEEKHEKQIKEEMEFHKRVMKACGHIIDDTLLVNGCETIKEDLNDKKTTS